jgi:lipid A 4'-phosphatase
LSSLASSRPYWLPQIPILVALAALGTLPFWLTDLDLKAAALFYSPGTAENWPVSQEPIWIFFYQAAPLLVGFVMLGGIAVLAGGYLWPRCRRLRIYALFVLLTMALGPGLVVNGMLKDHWGRPRPHQTLELGGTRAYLPPLVMGTWKEGKSFPCGHSSAGFATAAFFLIWLRRRPRLAAAALAGSLALGMALGVGRMSAGDHFLSDVIWSAVIVYTVAFVLYYFVLRIPQREDAEAARPAAEAGPTRHPVAVGLAFGLAAIAALAGVFAATPVQENRTLEIRTTDLGAGPRTLRVSCDQCQLILGWLGEPGPAVQFRLKGRGFGLPGTRVRERLETQGPASTLTVEHQGVFTEKDTSLLVLASPSAWQRIEVGTRSGDIRVLSQPARAPQLDLKTGDGRVLRDAP